MKLPLTCHQASHVPDTATRIINIHRVALDEAQETIEQQIELAYQDRVITTSLDQRHPKSRRLAFLIELAGRIEQFRNQPATNHIYPIESQIIVRGEPQDQERYHELIKLSDLIFGPFFHKHIKEVWLDAAIDFTTGNDDLSIDQMTDDWYSSYQALTKVYQAFRKLDPDLNIQQHHQFPPKRIYQRNGVKHRGWTDVTYRPVHAHMALHLYLEVLHQADQILNTGWYLRTSQ